MSKEKVIRNKIMNELGRDPSLLVLSNPSGVADYVDTETGKSYKVSYGLGGIPGGPDLIVFIYWKHARMVRGCQPIGIEVKRPGEQRTEAQETWARAAQMRGMRVERCESVEEATKFVNHVKNELTMIGLHPTRAEPWVYSIPG